MPTTERTPNADLTSWPLVTVRGDLADRREFPALARAMQLARGRVGSFAVVAHPGGGLYEFDQPPKATDLRWLARYRRLLAQRCAGLSIVVAEATPREALTRALAGACAWYGCPVRVDANGDAALAWAACQLEAQARGIVAEDHERMWWERALNATMR